MKKDETQNVAKPGNALQEGFRTAQGHNGQHREAPPPSNLPVAEVVLDPVIPWVDKRRFRQVMRANGKSVDAEEIERQTPIYPFTSGIQLTNDGVGFGEEIIESRVPSGVGRPAVAPSRPLRFRRTRSGKVPTKGNEKSFLGPSGRDNT